MGEMTIEIVEGQLSFERTAAQTLPEFLRHCANRDPQPLQIMKAALDLFYHLKQRYQEEVNKYSAFPLRKVSVDNLEKETRVGLSPKPNGVDVWLALEVVTAKEQEIRVPDDQKQIVFLAHMCVGSV